MIFLLGVGLIDVSAKAEQPNPATRYHDCLALARKSPSKGFDAAIMWRDLGGDVAAEHCAAVSLFGLKQYQESAKRLEALAQVRTLSPPLKTDILAQSAQGWFLSGDLSRADAVLSAALSISPDDPMLLTDRAQIRATQNDLIGAISDLDRALSFDPNLVDALVFRAAAQRLNGNDTAATLDANEALQIDSKHPEALLERGILRRQAGDTAGARQDWLQLIELYPNTVAAGMAQTNLGNMDVNKD